MWLQGRVWSVPIDPKKCCGTHSKEKEDKGECCQQEEQDRAEALTYEQSFVTIIPKEQNEEPGPEPKSVSQLLQEGMKLQRRLEDE